MTYYKRKYLRAAGLGVGAFLLGSVVLANDGPTVKPHSKGTYEKGSLTMPLHRGGAVAFETFLPKLPSNCEGEMVLDLSWDEEENWVKVHLSGKHILQRKPSIRRTEGVNFIPNAGWPEQKDFDNGRYQFWILSPAPMITFYYDATTLDMIGSENEYPTPPPGSIPVPIPGIKLFSTPFFEPDAEGNVDFTYTFAYDHCVRGDRPNEYAHHLNTYPPTNLCYANPVRYDLTTSRPYLSKPLPASQALSFSEYLRNGLIFDTTIEPDHYVTEPPLITATSAYSGMTVNGGGVPRHWALDLDAVFMNNAPPIRPFEYAGTCQDDYKAHHIKNINFCAPH